MKSKKADIITVSNEAGVSISTVSRFFNHPELLKHSTRLRIEEAVKRTGYIRNRAAQTIHGIRNGSIGLVVPNIDHMIFAELVQVFSDAVGKEGFTILLASHGYDLEKEYALTRKMLEHRVDGLALIGLEHADETYRLIEHQETPAVLLWNHAEDARLPCIGADNFAAGHLAGSHVAALGHRKIGGVFPPLQGNDRAAERYRGFQAALEEYGLAVPKDWTLEAQYSVAGAKSAVEALLGNLHRPTALICGNDVIAWGALHAASHQAISVPAALTITGIGDFKGSKDFEPALTTVRIPAKRIGQTAAKSIVRAIINPETEIASELIHPELIERNTSAAPWLSETGNSKRW